MSRKCLGSVRGSSSRRRLGVQERSRRGAGKGERLSSSLRAPAERMFVSCFWRQTLTLRSPARWWMPTIWFSYTWSRDVGRFGEMRGDTGRCGEMRGDLVLKHLVARRSEERAPLLRILQAVPRRRPLLVREQVAAIAPSECPGRGPGSVQEVSRVPVAAVALVKVARPRLVPREGGSHDRQPARRLLYCNLGSSRAISGQSLAPAGASPT